MRIDPDGPIELGQGQIVPLTAEQEQAESAPGRRVRRVDADRGPEISGGWVETRYRRPEIFRLSLLGGRRGGWEGVVIGERIAIEERSVEGVEQAVDGPRLDRGA